MRKKFFYIGLILLLSLTGCGKNSKNITASEKDTASADSERAYHKITAEEAKKMMEEETVVIVDVRTKEEYEEKHIPNAILIPNEDIDMDTPIDSLPDKDATLLVYCRSGNRSKQASDKLAEMGYKNIFDFGGILDWFYETETGGVFNDQ